MKEMNLNGLQLETLEFQIKCLSFKLASLTCLKSSTRKYLGLLIWRLRMQESGKCQQCGVLGSEGNN
jgi:hypothetical protein